MMADDRKNERHERGQSAVELCLALPFILFFMLSAIGIALSCIKGEVLSLASNRMARVEKVFQKEMVAAELYAMLTPEFFASTAVDWTDLDGNSRTSNWVDGYAEVGSASRGISNFGPLRYGSHLIRKSRLVPSLPKELSDGILRQGDAPSPYCRGVEGYAVCGY